MTRVLLQVALLASPLLGPAVWRPTAAVLTALGWDVLVVPGSDRPPRSPAEVRDHLLSHLPADCALGVVAHSNAGLYVPVLATERHVVATVFADAALPPGEGVAPMAPVAMQSFLKDRADADGVLPPWTQWWDEEQLAPLFPSVGVHLAVEREQHRLPLEYFTATIDVPAGWTARPAAYLAFGDTYRQEQEQADRWGWPVRSLSGGHLLPLTDPAVVATAVDQLLRRQIAPSGHRC